MPATEPQFTPTFILILRGSRLVSSSFEQQVAGYIGEETQRSYRVVSSSFDELGV
jgi:hypothetical protein